MVMNLNQRGLTTSPTHVLKAKAEIPQSQKADKGQVKNNAGGYSFKITPEQYLDRFLVLGTEGSTYYVGGKQLTYKAATNVIHMIKNPKTSKYTVDRALELSTSGRVISNDTALAVLALAMTYGTDEAKHYVASILGRVARTGTDILHFTKFIDELRGWGRGMKKTVANWYLSKTPEQVAFQAIKYPSRDGWSQRDVLRVSHPIPQESAMASVFAYITKGEYNVEDKGLPNIIFMRENLHTKPEVKTAVECIHKGLPREAIPTELLNDPLVWDALTEKSPYTALIRNLNKMTAVGSLKALNDRTMMVAERIKSDEEIKKGKMHPVKLLFAFKTYAEGKGDKGSLTWKPIPQITHALEEAFYKSFGYVEPSNKNMMVGLDISGSMGSSFIANSRVTCREASFALALISARAEPRTFAVAFDAYRTSVGKSLYNTKNGVRELSGFTQSTRLADYERICGQWNGGGTDCALPMLHALENKYEVDVFQIYTDNETWAGGTHPHVALDMYKQKMGRNAKLIVVGMTATNFTIAQPGRGDMMDVVGFDPATPDMISAFARGDI